MHTHTFLTPAQIEAIETCVPDALMQVKHLFLILEENQMIGFMGIQNRRLEMLFLHSRILHKGIGTMALQYAIENCSVTELTVNEQNLSASAFYRKNGFSVYKCSEKDEQGNPYPLLYMHLEKHAEGEAYV